MLIPLAISARPACRVKHLLLFHVRTKHWLTVIKCCIACCLPNHYRSDISTPFDTKSVFDIDTTQSTSWNKGCYISIWRYGIEEQAISFFLHLGNFSRPSSL